MEHFGFSDMYYCCTLYLQNNEVAAVQPPPVVHYSQSHSANNGAEQYSHVVDTPVQQPESHGSEHSQPGVDTQYNTHYSSHPDTRYPPQPDHRSPHTDHQYIPVQPERYPNTPIHRPSIPVHQPESHEHASGPGVSSQPHIEIVPPPF